MRHFIRETGIKYRAANNIRVFNFKQVSFFNHKVLVNTILVNYEENIRNSFKQYFVAPFAGFKVSNLLFGFSDVIKNQVI